MTSYKEDFYQYANDKWLNDESIVIPGDYPKWGSFVKLTDESLKNQIKILQELADSKGNLTKDEEKLKHVWQLSMNRFSKWTNGEGSLDGLTNILGETTRKLTKGEWNPTLLGEFFAWCEIAGIKAPIAIDTIPNLESSEDIVLELGPSKAFSLPGRDYYFEEQFEKQRQQYVDHLQNIQNMIGKDNLQDDFVNRVVRFETKLAMISMKNDQNRLYDQYYTITSLDEFVTGMNSLKSLEAKAKNFETCTFAFTDDLELLREANVTLSDVQLQDVKAFFETYIGKLELRSFMKKNFEIHYPDSKVDDSEKLIAFDGDYFRRIFMLMFKSSNTKDMVAFFQYKTILAYGSLFTKALDEEIFDFFSRKLGGQHEQKSPEKRSVGLVNAYMGELLGKVYVQRYFSEESKEEVERIIRDVIEIMKESLQSNDWLTQPTKEHALEKLSRFVYKIGYPAKFKCYDDVDIVSCGDLVALKMLMIQFDMRTELFEKLNTPKDKLKWEMTPQTCNAYYHPLHNEIVFPAAILQPPFYTPRRELIDMDIPSSIGSDVDVLTPMNYGGIGAVIAHEITHGYDDQGRKFDQSGNMNDWWTKEDTELFTAKTKLMAEQASEWQMVIDGKTHKLKPDLTMGENLADLGGLSLACQALCHYQAQNGIVSDVQDAQLKLFFLSWANVWKQKATDEYKVQQLNTDPHSPAHFRGNLVKNIDAFYRIFDVIEGDKMYLAPDKRVCMW